MRTMWGALALLAGANLAGAAPRHAAGLVTAPATRVGLELIRTVCPQLPVPCDPASVTAWVRPGDTAGPLYLIDAQRPMLVALDAAEPARVDRARQWDFHAYVHSKPPVSDLGSPEPLRLQSALSPVGTAGWAVALVSHSRETYSGGWASFLVADFVPLDAPDRVLYAAVPFSCSKVVRACFSEREYRRSHHCQDESNGHLTIRVGQGDAGWTFMWHETDWPAHRSRTRQTTTHMLFRVAPGKTESSPDPAFCGGPAN